MGEKLPEAYDSLKPKLDNKKDDYYVLVKNSGFEQILQENIYYIKKDKKYVVLYTEDGEKKERKSLQEVVGTLSEGKENPCAGRKRKQVQGSLCFQWQQVVPLPVLLQKRVLATSPHRRLWR